MGIIFHHRVYVVNLFAKNQTQLLT
uniref:Uncharacterized protein n=1 Tax=Arundo donax TaxID=35708 RepID=A0A0A9ERZ5_ARUDO